MGLYDRKLAQMIADKGAHNIDSIKQMDEAFKVSQEPSQLDLAGECRLARERRQFLDDVQAWEDE